MKKIFIFLILGLFLLTGCNQEIIKKKTSKNSTYIEPKELSKYIKVIEVAVNQNEPDNEYDDVLHVKFQNISDKTLKNAAILVKYLDRNNKPIADAGIVTVTDISPNYIENKNVPLATKPHEIKKEWSGKLQAEILLASIKK